jgi:hypothetical protein
MSIATDSLERGQRLARQVHDSSDWKVEKRFI